MMMAAGYSHRSFDKLQTIVHPRVQFVYLRDHLISVCVCLSDCCLPFFLSALPIRLSVLCRVVQELIRHKRNMIVDEDDDSNTPLHIACIHGHTEVADVLLKSGSDPNAR